MEENNTTTPQTPETVEQKPTKSRAKKTKRHVPVAELHIQATFNNTIITVTDKTGSALVASSAGSNGFRGSKKGTAYAAQIAAEKALEIAKRDFNVNSVDVFVKGIGLGRDSAIRATSANSISINSIVDVTPVKHGGCRAKKERKP